MGKCLNYVAVLMGAMGIVADVAAVPENIPSLAPLTQNALGVPANNGTYNLKDHYNHFHVNIQPPTNNPVEIVATNNLLADGTVSDTGTNGLVTSSASPSQFDAVFSICKTMAPIGAADYANGMSPLTAATIYFQNRGISLESTEPTKVTLVSGPQHGSLAPDAKYSEGVYIYKPTGNYLGTDQMVFTIEVKGKILKVIYSVEVIDRLDSGSPSCPNSFGIKELNNSATK